MRIRKLLAPAFSGRALIEQEPLLSHYFELFISKLTERVDSSSTVGARIDFMAFYNFVTFDIIRYYGGLCLFDITRSD
jgi:cytochrome P450